jgi:hypothetical protein
MADNTATLFQEALKYSYGVNRVLYLFNEEVVMSNILGSVKKPVGGRGQFIMPIPIQNTGAWSGVAEGGTIPTPLAADFTEASYSLKEFVGSYAITWKLMQDSRNDKFAFQQGIQASDDGLKRRIFRNINSDLLDDGRGRLAVLAGADDGAGGFTSTFLPRCEKGMLVDVVDTDNTTVHASGLTVSAVNPVTRFVDLSAAISSEAAGDCVVISGTLDSPIFLHTNGILGVIDDGNPAAGNIGGIDRTTAGNEFWQSVVLSNSGTNRPLTEDLLLQAMDYAREKGGGNLTHWMSNLKILQRYHELLAGERFVALTSPQAIGGGFGRKKMGGDSKNGETPYEFSGVPWHVDPYFHNNTVVGFDSKHFFLGTGENEVPRPVSEVFGGVEMFKRTTTTTFQVEWYYQFQLLTDNPAGGVKIEDVAEA